MVVVWASVVVVGLLVAVTASRRGIERAVSAAATWGAPPLAIGLSLVAIGTDLPEIANSIVASLTGNGDVNVGDSVGSAATQSTLVLGLVPWLAAPIVLRARRVLAVAAVTVVALIVGAALTSDGFLSRLDGASLLALWAGGTALAWTQSPQPEQPSLPLSGERPVKDSAVALGWFALVGVGATAAVGGMVELSEALGVPPYLVSMTVLALGTSLPELVVVLTAMRRGQHDLAVGDALGSSMVDATLSIGIGPLVAPVAVTASLAVRGALSTAVAVALATAVVAAARGLGRPSGAILLGVYVALYTVILSA